MDARVRGQGGDNMRTRRRCNPTRRLEQVDWAGVMRLITPLKEGDRMKYLDTMVKKHLTSTAEGDAILADLQRQHRSACAAERRP